MSHLKFVYSLISSELIYVFVTKEDLVVIDLPFINGIVLLFTSHGFELSAN